MKLIVRRDFYDLAAQRGRRHGEAFEADSDRAAKLISAGLVKEAGSAEEEKPRKAAAEKPATAKGEQAGKPKAAGKTAAKKPKAAAKPAAKKPEAETK